MMLQVIVHDGDVFAATYSKSGDDCIVLTEVSTQVYAYDVRVGSANLFDDRPRAVGRAIVNEHDFIIAAGWIERLCYCRNQGFETVLASIDGNYDREIKLKCLITNLPNLHGGDNSKSYSYCRPVSDRVGWWQNKLAGLTIASLAPRPRRP